MENNNIKVFKKNINDFLRKLNSEGISLAFLKDPATKKSSVSLTLLIISFNLVILGIIGKWGGYLKIDIGQSLSLFYACSALYFGRKITPSNQSEIKNEEKPQE